jgi:hypothetical protein
MLTIDTREFERKAEELGATADQMDFILSFALNKAAIEARSQLVERTWPKAIKQRNPTFIKAALRIEFSKKSDLTVSIYDRLQRAQLKRHAEGGTKLPKGRNLAIPTRNVRVGAHGVAKRMRPKNLPKDKTFVKNGKILQRVGGTKSKKVKVLYILKPSVHIKKDVPFYADFNSTIRKSLLDNLPAAVTRAMSTRRVR